MILMVQSGLALSNRCHQSQIFLLCVLEILPCIGSTAMFHTFPLLFVMWTVGINEMEDGAMGGVGIAEG